MDTDRPLSAVSSFTPLYIPLTWPALHHLNKSYHLFLSLAICLFQEFYSEGVSLCISFPSNYVLEWAYVLLQMAKLYNILCIKLQRDRK